MEKLKEKYGKLYRRLKESRDAENMRLFGGVMGVLFCEVADANPNIAAKALESLDGICYNNFLTEHEAEKIMSGFINADGSKGAKWSFADIENLCNSKELECCEYGEFNFYALATVMNMIYSDSAPVLAQMLGDRTEGIAFWVYRLAYLRLHDADRPRWVRSYFGL